MAISCEGKVKYSPDHFAMVQEWLSFGEDIFMELVKDYADSDEIIKAVKEGYFNEDYGKNPITDALSSRDNISLIKEPVTNLKAEYLRIRGGVSGDYNKMKKNFLRDLIDRVLLDSNRQRIPLQKIDTIQGVDELGNDKYVNATVLNKNLYEFKILLVKRLRKVINPAETGLDTRYIGDEELNSLISITLRDFQIKWLHKTKDLEKEFDTYFTLKYFSELASDLKSFFKVKEGVGDKEKLDMYEAVNPYVAYDVSFNPNEFATAEQYASEVLKTLLDYFTEDDSENADAIGFKGFNYAITRMIEWVDENAEPKIKRELDNGNNFDWAIVIDAYLASRECPNEIKKKLKGIRAIMTSGIDSTIVEMINEQRERCVRYQFESYRFAWDPILHKRVMVPRTVGDAIIESQKSNIARLVRSTVCEFRTNPRAFDDFLKVHKIERKGTTFIFKNAGKNGGNVVVTAEGNINAKYTFNVQGEDFNDHYIKSLIEDMFYLPITDDYDTLLSDMGKTKPSLWSVFKPAIMRTLAASVTEKDNGNNPFGSYKFEANGLLLLFDGSQFVDFAESGLFLSLMNGTNKMTVSKNGLGNDLPIYQQVSGIFKAKQILRRATSGEINNDKNYATWNTIYDESILREDPRTGESPIGGTFVRSDYDYSGTNKTSAQMNFRELTHLNITKSFLFNLYRKGGRILLQPTCLADKHTHFMIEYITDRINIDGFSLNTLLRNVASFSDDGSSASKLFNEIKKRQQSKVKTQIVNFLRRYISLHNYDIHYNSSYEEILAAIEQCEKTLNARVKNGEKLEDILSDLTKKGIHTYQEADWIEWDGVIHINETLFNNFQTYFPDGDYNPNSPNTFTKRMQKQMLEYARLLFKNRFVFDVLNDAELERILHGLSESQMEKWYDKYSGTMKAFILYDKNGQVVTPEYGANLDSYFDSNKYKVELNPVVLSYYLADNLLSKPFCDIVFGEDYVIEAKALKTMKSEKANASARVDELDNIEIPDLRAKLKEIGTKIDKASGDKKESLKKEYDDLNKKLNNAISERDKLNTLIENLSWGTDYFFQTLEASRLGMHYKRTVHGGATYTPLLQGLKWGVASKVKVAVYKDTQDPMFTVTGDTDMYTSQDGSGAASSYMSRMCNRSYVDGAVNKNKKTIFSYVDPVTGALVLIKWAEFELTNSIRRDSPIISGHSSRELMFKKMHNLAIKDGFAWNKFNLSDYYNINAEENGIVHTKPIYRKVLDTDFPIIDNKGNIVKAGTHLKLLEIKSTNGGHNFEAVWQVVDEKGNIVKDVPKVTIRNEINSIYDMDQAFGGAYCEELNDEGYLDWSEAQNDIVYTIICNTVDKDGNAGFLKDNFVGFCINASAVKSGMQNVNPADSFDSDDNKELTTFDISTRTGGAQMNADHIIDEAEVTEMSQMISALIQSGLKTHQVDRVYDFIGRLITSSLQNINDWLDNPADEAKVYKWIGEAVARAFESGRTDTLGLAGAFIARANRNFRQNNIKTKIPLSANTVKGLFEATITSTINKMAIYRKYPGGGFVQNPTFDVKLRFNIGGASYSYTEFAEHLIELNKENAKNGKYTNYTAPQVLTDPMWRVSTNLGVRELQFDNPFIQKLDVYGHPELDRHSIDIGDTVIIWKDEDLDPANYVNGHPNYEIVTCREFEDYDRVRNLSGRYHVAKWTCKPKNLLGNRTFFTAQNGVTFSLYDLDSVRVSIYADLLKRGKSKQKSNAIAIIEQFVANRSDLLNYLRNRNKIATDDSVILDSESLNTISKYAKAETKTITEQMSNQNADGSVEISNQFAFDSLIGDKVSVKNINTSPAQILIGLSDAKMFGIQKSSDLTRIQKEGIKFFESKFRYMTVKPDESVMDTENYDYVAYNIGDKKPTFAIIKDYRDKNVIPSGCVINQNYKVGADGHIYKGEVDLGLDDGKEFYTIIGNDGVEYELIAFPDKQSFIKYNTENKIFSNYIANYNRSNIHNWVMDISRGTKRATEFSIDDMNEKEAERQVAVLTKIAKSRMQAWNAYKKAIGTRIPAQSMQSFTPLEIVGFTDDDTTQVFVSTMMVFLQGADFDIDKLYIMMLGFLPDGSLATYSDLDEEFDAEKCLDLPLPQKRKFDVMFTEDPDIADANGYTFLNIEDGGIDLINKILSQSETKIALSRKILTNPKWNIDSIDKDLTPEKVKANLQNWLNTHEKTVRNGYASTVATRNVIVRTAYKIITDVATQYNLQIPVEMKDLRKIAENSTLGTDERRLTADNPGAKLLMQIQNMIGRDVIGIGASSLKGFFGASTYFNLQTVSITKLLTERGENPNANIQDIDSKIWKHILNVCFDSKFTKRGLITLANVNYRHCIAEAKRLGIKTIHISTTEYKSYSKSQVGLSNYCKPTITLDGRSVIEVNLETLLNDLEKAANGSWDSPIDAAYSLSQLITAATDSK